MSNRATVRKSTSRLGRTVPIDWVQVSHNRDGAAYRHLITDLTVIESAAKERDNNRWLHISISHPSRLPTWEELKRVKSIWIGDDRDAIQVLPRDEKYVNLDPFCLHLWYCLDSIPLPDFTRGGKTV